MTQGSDKRNKGRLRKGRPRVPLLEEGARAGRLGKRDQAGARFFASLRMTGGDLHDRGLMAGCEAAPSGKASRMIARLC